MAKTDIEWATDVWNPIRGCSHVSEGCRNCYAEKIAERFSGACEIDEAEGIREHDAVLPPQPFHGYAERGKGWTGKVELLPDKLADPVRWRKPRERIFVNSTSDLFHEKLGNEEIAAVFGAMAAAPRHTFLVLTKRAKRMCDWFRWIEEQGPRPHGEVFWHALCYERDATEEGDSGPIHCRNANDDAEPWPLPNVWLIVTAEDQERADERVPDLLATPAAVRGVSLEPMLEAVDVSRWMPSPAMWAEAKAKAAGGVHGVAFLGLDWVIVGGESGPTARRCDVAWIRSVVEQCRAAKVPVFVKQLGARSGTRNKVDGWDSYEAGHGGVYIGDRKGGKPAEWPADLRVREFPR